MNKYRAERGDVDQNNFNVWIKGEGLAFRAEREILRDNKRGHWLLFKCGPTGSANQPIDRDQYSNDLLERIECGHYDEFTLLEDRVGCPFYHDCNPRP